MRYNKKPWGNTEDFFEQKMYTNMMGMVQLCLHGNVKGSDSEVALKMWWFIYMKCDGDG